MVAACKFRFKAPVRSGLRFNPGNPVHHVRHPLRRILQAQIHAPEEARIRFAPERRRRSGRALTLVEGRDAEERTVPKSISRKGKFRAGAEQHLVINFEQRLAFEFHRDFLVRIESGLAQKLDLPEFVVHVVIHAAGENRRSGLQLFGAFRNVHAAACADGIARIRIAHADDRVAPLADTFKVEAARVLGRDIRNGKRVKIRHRCGRIHVAERFQAVFPCTRRRIRPGIPRKRTAGQPHFTRIRPRSVLFENRRVAGQNGSRRRIDQPKRLQVGTRNARLVL